MNTESLKQILTNVKATSKTICYRTEIKPAAKHKNAVQIEKNVCANVTLFGQPDDSVSLYRDLVRQRGIGENAETFEPKKTFFEHDRDFYSLIRHRETGKEYLYCIFENTLSSEFYLNGEISTREVIAEYLTPSEAKKLLNPAPLVKNVSENIEHDVIVRTIGLGNVVSIEDAQ